MQLSAKSLSSTFGCKSVLLKGGHLQSFTMTDILWVESEQKEYCYSSERIETKNLHGTGCSLSSAITTFLALGDAIPQAVQHAKQYITFAIATGKDVVIGQGNGPVNHFFDPKTLEIININ
jgi:hydroxymethylpyrimidine/phosphomethylpyrimidine kinase